MENNAIEGRTYGNISELYDKARVSYPQELINDIIDFSGLKAGKVLDLGCGTGQATLLFAERGFSVTGLDVSDNMIEVAKKKCSQYPNVNFLVGAFDEINLQEKEFNLVISAMAWH